MIFRVGHNDQFANCCCRLLPPCSAGLLSAVITWAIRPMLLQVALAKPNARSSHRIPTPQGAGIAVIAATLIVAAAIDHACRRRLTCKMPVAVFAATLFIAAVGFADDVSSIPVLPRLLLQGLAVAAVIVAAPERSRIVPACPALDRARAAAAGRPLVREPRQLHGRAGPDDGSRSRADDGALVLLGWLGELPASTTIVAAALCGAMLGFSPFNRPVAKIFLGDVGSLPIGLLLGWCLLQLAWHQQFAAALLLPLYYLADATVTLFRRMARREPFWAAHRTHFYQRATDNGFTVWRVVSEVFVLNIVLAALAIGSVATSSAVIDRPASRRWRDRDDSV